MLSIPHLKIVLEKGKDLPKRDFTGKSDPFVVFTLGEETVKSSIRYQTLNPVWNETLILKIPEGDLKSVTVQCFDWDLTQNESMGKTSFSLEKLKKNHTENMTLKLDEETGEIEISVTAKNYGEFSGKTIALLGCEESGKTSFFKHFQMKNGKKLSESLNEIHAFLLYWTKEVIESCFKTFEIPFKDGKNLKMSEIILKATKQEDYKFKGTLFLAAPGVFAAFISVWSEPNMLETIKKKNGKDFHLVVDNPEKVFSVENLKKFSIDENFTPFESDFKVLLKNTIIFMKESFIMYENENNENDARKFTLGSDLKNFIHLLKDKNIISTLNQHYFDYPEKVLLTFHPFSKYLFENYCNLPKNNIKVENQITVDDILTLNLSSNGKDDFTASINGFEICLLDIGGSEKEKPKWSLYIPQELFAIIFVIDLSSYDLHSQNKEEATNRILNSVERLENSTGLFKNRKLVLFFNKVDKFKQKIKTKDISKEFDQYKGGANYDQALEFIQKLFYDVLGQKPLSYVGSSLNYPDVQKVIELLLEGEKAPSKRSSLSPKPKNVSQKITSRNSFQSSSDD